jgi:hypothetical protein
MERAKLCGEHSVFLKQPWAAEEHVLGGARELPDNRSHESRFRSEFAGILQVEIRQ